MDHRVAMDSSLALLVGAQSAAIRLVAEKTGEHHHGLQTIARKHRGRAGQRLY